MPFRSAAATAPVSVSEQEPSQGTIRRGRNRINRRKLDRTEDRAESAATGGRWEPSRPATAMAEVAYARPDESPHDRVSESGERRASADDEPAMGTARKRSASASASERDDDDAPKNVQDLRDARMTDV
ncbi:MAG: hypothetical protein M1815_002846 [Lichina confinis]|nr:MAG: hypothetical protein M1815_002846 [Lichina confinis]